MELRSGVAEELPGYGALSAMSKAEISRMLDALLSMDALKTETEGQRYLDEYAALSAGKAMESWLEEDKVFWDVLDQWNKAVADYQVYRDSVS